MAFSFRSLLLPALAFLLGASNASAKSVAARNGMVVSAHPLATKAGLAILKLGGNAVDAAVATSLVLGVVEPYSSGIGGGGFMMLYLAGKKKVLAVDFRERAPLKSSRDMFVPGVKAGKQPSRLGGLAVGVPGQIAGLYEVHKKYGKLSWRRVLRPAIRLALRGFPVTPKLIRAIGVRADKFNDAGKKIFLPRGKIPKLGQRLVQRDLGRLLSRVARLGSRGFYQGRFARKLVAGVQKHGGIITLEDLKSYQVKYRQPIEGSYRGRRIYSMPPPSSGGLHLVQMLNTLQHFDLKSSGFNSSRTIHIMAEVMKHAYRDRARFLGDPDFTRIPVKGLLSPLYARKIARWIRVDRRQNLVESNKRLGPVRFEHGSTSHFSIIDRDGNAVGLTQTINLWFGSCVVAAGTGVVLNNEMDDFSIIPGLPNAFGLLGGEANAVAPGKRPLSSMTPTLVLKGDRVEIVAGSPGGSRIITTVLQILLNILEHGMTVGNAVAGPRFHFQWWPDVLFFEPHGLSQDTVSALRKLGHVVKARSPMGNAQVIRVDLKTGLLWGGADPRGEGLALGH